MALKIVEADVQEPAFDEHQRIMVIPRGLTRREQYRTMLILFCERGECGHDHAIRRGFAG